MNRRQPADATNITAPVRIGFIASTNCRRRSEWPGVFPQATPWPNVVLDLKLPGISGKELCREFKSIAAAVPIVVLSANSEVEDKVLLLELGADDYVTKPFSPPKELLARVRRAMRRTAAPQPSSLRLLPEPEAGDFDLRRRACRFHQHGGNALRKVHHPDHPGVQVVEVSRVFTRQSRLSRGTSQRSLGIPELSIDQNGGQSYPPSSPET